MSTALGVAIIAGTVVVMALPTFGIVLMFWGVDGPPLLVPGLFVANAVGCVAFIVWAVVGERFPSTVREERIHITTAGLEHVEVHARGDRVRRLPWHKLVSVRLDDAGDRVLARTGTRERVVAHFGSREQRAAVTDALRERLRRRGADIPARLQSGWTLARPAHLRRVPDGTAGRSVLIVRRGLRRVLWRIVGGGFYIFIVPFAAVGPMAMRWQIDPVRSFLLMFGVPWGVWLVYQLVWAGNRAPALVLGQGSLAYGVINPRTGHWREPPEPVAGLRLYGTLRDDDHQASYALTALLSSGSHRAIDARDGGSTLRETAAWLAETTGVPVEDTVATAD